MTQKNTRVVGLSCCLPACLPLSLPLPLSLSLLLVSPSLCLSLRVLVSPSLCLYLSVSMSRCLSVCRLFLLLPTTTLLIYRKNTQAYRHATPSPTPPPPPSPQREGGACPSPKIGGWGGVGGEGAYVYTSVCFLRNINEEVVSMLAALVLWYLTSRRTDMACIDTLPFSLSSGILWVLEGLSDGNTRPFERTLILVFAGFMR